MSASSTTTRPLPVGATLVTAHPVAQGWVAGCGTSNAPKTRSCISNRTRVGPHPGPLRSRKASLPVSASRADRPYFPPRSRLVRTTSRPGTSSDPAASANAGRRRRDHPETADERPRGHAATRQDHPEHAHHHGGGEQHRRDHGRTGRGREQLVTCPLRRSERTILDDDHPGRHGQWDRRVRRQPTRLLRPARPDPHDRRCGEHEQGDQPVQLYGVPTYGVQLEQHRDREHRERGCVRGGTASPLRPYSSWSVATARP